MSNLQKITIIPADSMVGINGQFYRIDGLSEMYPDVHAVQWDGISGRVEGRSFGINSLDSFQGALDAWQLADTKRKSDEQAELDKAALASAQNNRNIS